MEGQTEGRDAAGEVSVEIGGCSRAKGSVNEDAYLADVGHLLFGVFELIFSRGGRQRAEPKEAPSPDPT